MSLEEKIFYYNTHLKNKTLARLKEYFKSSKEDFDKAYLNYENPNLFTLNQNELENKKRDYIEILDLLHEYEYEIILYSIYF